MKIELNEEEIKKAIERFVRDINKSNTAQHLYKAEIAWASKCAVVTISRTKLPADYPTLTEFWLDQPESKFSAKSAV